MLTATSTTLLFVGAGCFVFGYILATAASFPLSSAAGGGRDGRWNRTLLSRLGSALKTCLIANRTMPREEEDGGDPPSKKTSGKTKQQGQKKIISPLLEIESLAEILEDFKMVLVARNDLKMGKGKVAAQCSHATLGLYKKLILKAPKALNRWEMCGQVKVVLKCESEEDMLALQERARLLKLPTHITIDAGRTQIAPNSRTVMAILGPADIVDDVTGGLKLL